MIVVATRNQGKLVEIRALLADLDGARVLAIDEVGVPVPEVEEDGATFRDNALKKARVVAQATGMIALADDSGLEVDALDGLPGVRSARYAGERASDGANNAKLLSALAEVPRGQRGARFRTVVALVDPAGGEPETAEGTCEGAILEAPRGDGGFGYDPLFWCPELGSTFAEATREAKSSVSHRGRALRALAPALRAAVLAKRGGAG